MKTQKYTENQREIISIAGGHLTHDFYTAFLAPLLPSLMDNLSINLTGAGLLTSLSRLPFIFNPVFGYIADIKGTRYFMILAPGLTATLMSLLGSTSSIYTLGFLLFLAGLSSTFFHASSPALVAQASAERKGRGLSLFMAGGGIGRSLGPIAVVWAVSMWGLEGLYRLMFFGWCVSLILFLQFRSVKVQPQSRDSLQAEVPLFKRLFFPLALILLLRSVIIASLSTYLPVFMVESGAPLWLAGTALSIHELSGVIGALVLGPISDKVGRKKIISISMLISSLLIPLFLQAQGWQVFPVLVIIGFFLISTGTIFMALVQDNFHHHRSTGNSIFILINFMSNALMLIVVGFIGDTFGLELAYLIGAGAGILSIPAMYLLPARPRI
jgi:FSR family fosmidomycin resistance protein-like MFS transporter